MPSAEETDDQARATVVAIIRQEIRLVPVNPDDPESTYMIKPGNLEHMAKLIVQQLYS